MERIRLECVILREVCKDVGNDPCSEQSGAPAENGFPISASTIVGTMAGEEETIAVDRFLRGKAVLPARRNGY